MASGAIRAIGLILGQGNGDGPPETFNPIAEVLDITGPGLTNDLIDVTNQASLNNFREFIAGAKDGGELTFDINYLPDDASHNFAAGLLGDWDAGVNKNYQIQFPPPTVAVWVLPGVITNFGISANVNEQLKASITIKVVGAPTLE